jgi:hypothetical protein
MTDINDSLLQRSGLLPVRQVLMMSKQMKNEQTN